MISALAVIVFLGAFSHERRAHTNTHTSPSQSNRLIKFHQVTEIIVNQIEKLKNKQLQQKISGHIFDWSKDNIEFGNSKQNTLNYRHIDKEETYWSNGNMEAKERRGQRKKNTK